MKSRLKLAGLVRISHTIFSPVPNEPAVRQRVAIVLADSSNAHLVREVHELVVDNFVDDPSSAQRDVRSSLTHGYEFVCVDRCQLAAWSGGRALTGAVPEVRNRHCQSRCVPFSKRHPTEESRVGNQPWEHRLPEGVHLSSRDADGFSLGVSLPVGEDGLLPLRCPTDRAHLFKLQVTPGGGEPSDLYCPYCGHSASSSDFLADQMPVLKAAMEAAAEQFVHQSITDMLGDVFGTASRSRSQSSGFGMEFSFNPGTPPAPRSLPSYEVEETRRTMQCQQCQETYAVYGLAIYCPCCGQLAPSQQFAELVRVHQARLDAFDQLDPDSHRSLTEAGALAANYESTVKDGFGALETFLKQRFLSEATNLTKPPQSTVFQRLDDANALYVEHLDVDLAALAGVNRWNQLHRSAAIRHVLVHNNGVVDEKFLRRQPDWSQSVGQRIQVGRTEADNFLTALVAFAEAVAPDRS